MATRKQALDPLDELAQGDPLRVIALMLWKNRHREPDMYVQITERDIEGFEACVNYLKVKPTVLIKRPREAHDAGGLVLHALWLRQGERDRAILQRLRPEGPGAARAPALHPLQDRLVRAGRPRSHQPGHERRQADDHLHWAWPRWTRSPPRSKLRADARTSRCSNARAAIPAPAAEANLVAGKALGELHLRPHRPGHEMGLLRPHHVRRRLRGRRHAGRGA
jgi:hypothetical protein